MEVNELFAEYEHSLYRRIDRSFAWLMIAQWIFASIIATTTSLYAGPVWAPVLWGGLISSLPLYLALFRPGEKISRYTISVAQICFSGLFIHLVSDRPEAYFHVFCSLAFIAVYREWRLLATASIIIIFDRFIQDLYFPHSIYSMAVGVHWQWLENAGWIIFEDIFLCYGCILAKKEMRQIVNSNLELMKVRMDLEKLNIGRTQFISVISHEIRTPLTGIIGFSNFLKESTIPEEQREYVNIIKQCSDTLMKLSICDKIT